MSEDPEEGALSEDELLDELYDNRPEGTEFVWSEADLAELWASIIGDSCIEPSNWRAAFQAVVRGDEEWWLAVDRTEGESEV